MLRQAVRTARVVCPLSFGFLIGALLSLAVYPSLPPHTPLDECVYDASLPHINSDIFANLQHIRHVAANPPVDEPFEAVIRTSPGSVAVPATRTTTPAERPKVLRPRFMAGELGIRDKLHVVVLPDTSASSHSRGALAINKTVSQHVNRLTFIVGGDTPFTGADNVNTVHVQDVDVGGDARRLLRVFDELFTRRTVTNYDWVFVMLDTTYLKAFKLNELVTHMSIGTPVMIGAAGVEGARACDLHYGLLMSQELLQQLYRFEYIMYFSHTDYSDLASCLTVSPPAGDNEMQVFTRCLHRSNSTCALEWNGKMLRRWPVPTGVDLLAYMATNASDAFNAALTVAPLTTDTHYYHLHKYYCQLEINALDTVATGITHEIITTIQQQNNNERRDWPADVPTFSRPHTRYEVQKWQFFTEHDLFPNGPDENVLPLTGVDRTDVDQVVDACRAHLLQTQAHSVDDTFVRLTGGYRLFDPNRGMNYVLDLAYSMVNGGEHEYRVHLMRPLARAEMIQQTPYVTEDTNITLVVAVAVVDTGFVQAFVQRYQKVCTFVENGKKHVHIVFAVYEPEPNESAAFTGALDTVRQSLATWTQRCTNTHHFDVMDLRVSAHTVAQAFDAVVRARGLDILYVAMNVWTEVCGTWHAQSSALQTSIDCLNRVRLNTIRNYQVFAPIAFHAFDPHLADMTGASGNMADVPHQDYLIPLAVRAPTVDAPVVVHKDQGRFNAQDYSLLAAYGADWTAVVDARWLVGDELVGVFLNSRSVHIMRAPDPQLIVHYHDVLCIESLTGGDSESYARCLSRRRQGLASKAQLAKLILARAAQTDAF